MKIVCISDSHLIAQKLSLPKGDVLIHAGDFCNWGTPLDAVMFNADLLQYPFKHKIVVAGNHDKVFEQDPHIAQGLLDHKIHYLKDSAVIIKGIKFYGTPWQPAFGEWAFNKTEAELVELYKQIPEDVDVLITHCPPYGILDSVGVPYGSQGSKALRDRVAHVQPLVHVFGHIHEGYGQEQHGSTKFVNCSLLNGSYNFTNKPIVIEI